MAWIESHQELRHHPKTKRLARRLGISVPTAIGHLHCLWWWALDYAPDGDISDYDAEDIADAAMWDGDAEQFLQALIECGPGASHGFVERDEHGMRLHDWDDYGNEHKVRREAAERKRRSRERRRLQEQMSRDSHVTVTGQGRDGHGDVTLDKTRQDKTGQDRTDKHTPSRDTAESYVGRSSVEYAEPSADMAAIARHYGERIGMLGPSIFADLGDWHDRGMAAEVIMAAIDRTAEARSEGRIRGSPDSYLRGVIRQMYNDGIRTVADLQARNRADPRRGGYDEEAALAYLDEVLGGLSDDTSASA